MKGTIIVLICFVLAILFVKYLPTAEISAPPDKTSNVQDGLEQKAIKLTELYDNKNCREFFNIFPNTFHEFNQLYGFDDENGEHILYSKGNEHITYLFDCSEVSDLEKLNKAIEVGINGKWEADIVWMFRESSFKLVKDYLNDAKEILDTLPNEKAASFWLFLVDGPHPEDKTVVKRVDLLSNLLGKNSKQSKLLLEQYEKVKISWKDH